MILLYLKNKQIHLVPNSEIGGCQKGNTCPCASRCREVAGCHTFFSISTQKRQIQKIWHPATYKSLEAHEQLVPFTKPPFSNSMELRVHGHGMTFKRSKVSARNSHFIR